MSSSNVGLRKEILLREKNRINEELKICRQESKADKEFEIKEAARKEAARKEEITSLFEVIREEDACDIKKKKLTIEKILAVFDIEDCGDCGCVSDCTKLTALSTPVARGKRGPFTGDKTRLATNRMSFVFSDGQGNVIKAGDSSREYVTVSFLDTVTKQSLAGKTSEIRKALKNVFRSLHDTGQMTVGQFAALSKVTAV